MGARHTDTHACPAAFAGTALSSLASRHDLCPSLCRYLSSPPPVKMPSLTTNNLRKKMQAVGIKLESAEYQHFRMEINKMLDEDHGIAEPCCRLLRSGLLKEVLETTFEKMTPTCDTRLGLLSKTVKMNVLKARAPEKLTKDVASAIQKKLATFLNEIFYFALAADKSTPVTEHVEKAFIQDMVFGHLALGCRLQYVELGPAGNIDWDKSGIYRLVLAEGDSEAKIQHKPTKTEAILLTQQVVLAPLWLQCATLCNAVFASPCMSTPACEQCALH